MGYGTGAIMGVPGQDERDWEFATRFELPIVRTVAPPDGWTGEAYLGEGPAINSANDEISLDGLSVEEAKAAISASSQRRRPPDGDLPASGLAVQPQRYWGEPFPIVYDEHDLPLAIPDSMLPVELPDVPDYAPRTFPPDDTESDPEPPLARVPEWVEVELDLGDGPKRYRRDTNTMPNWAGSCWYELRYIDPTNTERLVDPENERYWMGPQGPERPEGSTSTSAASNTRSYICCTPGSGTRCSSTSATSPARSRSTGCSIRDTSRPTRSPTSAVSTFPPSRSWRRSRAPKRATSLTDPSPVSTGRWARA